MNFEQERKHLRLVKLIQPRPPPLLFHELKSLVPLSEVYFVPTAPDRYAHKRLQQDRLNIMRASAESLHGHQVIGSFYYLPQHVVVARSNVFGLQHYLAEAFPSSPDRLFIPVVGVREPSHPVG